jgi:hypothetical protein
MIKRRGKAVDEKERASRNTTSRTESIRDEKGSSMPRTNMTKAQKAVEKAGAKVF